MELCWDPGGLSWGLFGATLAHVGPWSVDLGPSWLRMAPCWAPRAPTHPILAHRGAPGTSGSQGCSAPRTVLFCFVSSLSEFSIRCYNRVRSDMAFAGPPNKLL